MFLDREITKWRLNRIDSSVVKLIRMAQGCINEVTWDRQLFEERLLQNIPCMA